MLVKTRCRRVAALLALWCVLLPWTTTAAEKPSRAEIERITRRLVAMNRVATAARVEHRQWANVDADNTAALKRLLKTYGWFTIGTWGKVPDQNALLIVLHSQELQFQ